ncbi:hypothetical protein OG402_40940 [Streptomyces anulatus]|uniref:hypothetical protein n=1 Tax=Streptomyces anulatus TaxID=1892 RepID=UPI00224CF6AB|nr:hypothetical protein [Streptomyces anulatus]MCX4606795.1 hypothetical protein [Streptomyces anulatus]
MSPSPITTLALLSAIHDHQKAYNASTGWARTKLLTPWRILSAVYSEEIVDAAYAREANYGHLERATCSCAPTCDLCLLYGVTAWLTDKGAARLAELQGVRDRPDSGA